MKKYLFLLLVLSLMGLSSCQRTSASEGTAESEDLTFETEAVQSFLMDNPAYNQHHEDAKPPVEEDLSGKVIILDDESFVEKVTEIDNEKGFQYKGETPCIVDFYADWCRPCSMLHPTLVSLAKEYKGKLIIYKVNTDKCANVATAFQISSIPTLLFFKKNSEKIGIVQGAVPKAELKKVIDKFLEE